MLSYNKVLELMKKEKLTKEEIKEMRAVLQNSIPVITYTRICGNPYCNNKFNTYIETKKYCCIDCQFKASDLRRKERKTNNTSPNIMSPEQAKFYKENPIVKIKDS